MTEASKSKAIIIGSFCLYLINLASMRDQTKGSVIRLKQKLFAQTRKPVNLHLVKLSNDAWQIVVDKYENQTMRIMLADATEMLVLDEEKAMKEVYGDDIVDLAYRASTKIQQDDSDAEPGIIKESREITEALIDASRKVVFDYLKEKRESNV